MDSIHLRSITASAYRVPVEVPVQTSFGMLRDRAAVMIRIADETGHEGFGEVWCNFPAVGAEHRARLVTETIAPLALARPWDSPVQCHRELSQSLHILAVQAGEPGPISQALAGFDIAMWDLAARRAGMPLWRMLGGTSSRVHVYASGLNPTAPERLASAKAQEGHTSFKLKVGFGAERDLANLAAMRATLGESATLMVDANQAWSVDQAIAMADRMAGFDLRWLEEPIAADFSLQEWQRLAQDCAIPLAAGENLRGDDFGRYLDAGVLKVLQPDVAKWGGFSRCMPLGEAASRASAWLCPHWLGGGIGLLATYHLKAALGGDGYAEVDANPNPLRELLAGELPPLHNGGITLTETHGLGAMPQSSALNQYKTAEKTVLATEL